MNIKRWLRNIIVVKLLLLFCFARRLRLRYRKAFLTPTKTRHQWSSNINIFLYFINFNDISSTAITASQISGDRSVIFTPWIFVLSYPYIKSNDVKHCIVFIPQIPRSGGELLHILHSIFLHACICISISQCHRISHVINKRTTNDRHKCIFKISNHNRFSCVILNESIVFFSRVLMENHKYCIKCSSKKYNIFPKS